ncbi:putative Ring finger protein [Quillaja saponaria]|uniref:RING-type E3 ubiquitin transferase n=1 Tax=Quillaja saponaria TaxID=32244 RepID=A0AAD7VKU9_QUISA|nr:putative Ring finger protein [Quillaja saponaria]
MGGARGFNPFNLFFFFGLFSLFIIFSSTNAADATDSGETPPLNPGNNGGGGRDGVGVGVGDGNDSTKKPNALLSPSPLPRPAPSPHPHLLSSLNHNEMPNSSPFRPSIAVIVGVLTTLFSITLVILLYAKHCKRGTVVVAGTNSRGGPVSNTRKNSGIDRAVIESLPIFRFGSLRGQKDGLECAVCLNGFEPTEVLRLLPKCKHAFHVECVDTWLDAHSTCPLCRYRVDPEDILLVEDAKTLPQNQPIPLPSQDNADVDLVEVENGRRRGSEPELQNRDSDSNQGFRRVSGRHSSAGEKGSHGILQMISHRPSESDLESGYRNAATSFRRSVDSIAPTRKKGKSESVAVAVGCFERPRKDGLLLTENTTSFERRFDHRIIVSPKSNGFHQRWSDVQPSDLLYLTSEMIITNRRRFSSASRQQQQNMQLPLHWNRNGNSNSNSNRNRNGRWWVGGRSVINARSLSEITGLSRFSNRGNSNNINRYREQEQEQQRH